MAIQNRQLYVSTIRPICYMRLNNLTTITFESGSKMSQNYAITLIAQIRINKI